MQTTRSFIPNGDRYRFDFGICSVKNGFAQVDTGQDAWYFGTWANPVTLTIVNYCEGDVSVRVAQSPEEFAEELKGIKTWNEESGHHFSGIDTMCNDDLDARFEALGLGELTH